MRRLFDDEGRWRRRDRDGNELWPRVYRDDYGLHHTITIKPDADSYNRGPYVTCTGHRAHAHGIQEDYPVVTCLWCLVMNPSLGGPDAGDKEIS